MYGGQVLCLFFETMSTILSTRLHYSILLKPCPRTSCASLTIIKASG